MHQLRTEVKYFVKTFIGKGTYGITLFNKSIFRIYKYQKLSVDIIIIINLKSLKDNYYQLISIDFEQVLISSI